MGKFNYIARLKLKSLDHFTIIQPGGEGMEKTGLGQSFIGLKLFALLVVEFCLINVSITLLAQVTCPTHEMFPGEPLKIYESELLIHEIFHLVISVGLGCLTLDPLLGASSVFSGMFLDLDHIFWEGPHPVRPSHSLIFLVLLAATYWKLHKRKDVVMVSISSFMGHIAIDTGRGPIPFFSPLSFAYFYTPTWMAYLWAAAALGINVTLLYINLSKRKTVYRTRQVK